MTHALRIFIAAAGLALFALPASAEDRQTDTDSSTRGPTDHSATAPDSGAGGGTTTTTGGDTSTATTTSDMKMVKDLLAQGFEIKSVTLIPSDIVKAGGATTAVDAVMILVQRGPIVANCYVAFSSFVDGSYYSGVASCTVLK